MKEVSSMRWLNNALKSHQSRPLFLHGECFLPIFLSRKRRVNTRTRRDQVHRLNQAFEGQMEGMTDAYLHWFSSLGDAGLANDHPVPSTRELQDEYPVEVLDTFGLFHKHAASILLI
jgi:hypothetical protein